MRMTFRISARRPVLALALALTACPLPGASEEGDDGTTEPGTTSTGSDGGSTTTADPASTSDSSSDGADSTGSAPGDDLAEQFLGRLPGLWIAPVTSMTSVGSFPIMAMDIRPADDRTLFSRIDLDANNSLRFAFTVEEHDGEATLVFRNGGDFLGFLRDTRTTLVEHDPEADRWRFCATAGGCDYVDARFTFEGSNGLTLATDVMGRPHMHWEGVLEEERPLDGAFPYDDTPGAADDPFPPMPTLRVTLSWTEPTLEAVDAWIILSTTDCGVVPGSCQPSHFIRATVEPGATSVELVLEQIHAGTYAANAVLDFNGNLATSLFPDSGDLVSIPNEGIEVAPRGETETQLMLWVEL